MSKKYSTHKQILNEMKRMMVEADTIKYKQDGESKEMPADSAKKMPDDHPAKQAWLSKQKGDSDDSGEKVKGADLFKSKEGEPKPNSDEPSDSGSDIKDTPELPEKGVDDMLNNTPDKNAEFSEKYGIDVKEFRSMDEGGWGYLEDELFEKGIEANSSFDINTDSEHGDPFNVYIYDDFAVYVDSYSGNFDITTKQDLAAGLKSLSSKSDSPKDDDGGDGGGDSSSFNNQKDTPTIPEKAVDDMLNNSTDRNSQFSEKTGIDLTQFKDMDEGGWGYLEDELIEKGIEPDNSFDINTDNEHGDPINVHVYGDFAVYVDSYTGNFNVTSKQDLAAGLKAIIGKNESVNESFLSSTAKIVLSRRIR